MERQAPDESLHARTSCQNHLRSPATEPSENTHQRETIENPPSYAEAILLPSYKGDAPPSTRSVTQQLSVTTTFEFHTPTTVGPPSTFARPSVYYIAAPSPQQPNQQHQQPQVVSVLRISSCNVTGSVLHYTLAYV